VLAALLLPAAAPAALAAECPRTTLADVEDEVMCPICGTPLALATEAPQAIQQRDYIQTLIDDCRSKDEVKAALAAQFGDSVLALPGDQGDDDLGDLLVYIVPALGILLAGGGILFALVRWRGNRTGRGGEPHPAAAGTDQRRLDADMERYDL
jgi:cytochrome c-type biogenesis protein CcmH